MFLSFDLELTNHCLNNCAICPRDKMVRPLGYMKPETFAKFIEQTEDMKCLITLSGMGDPLLHPHCMDFIEKLRCLSRSFGLVVNIVSLTRGDMIDDLIAASPGSITVSFPSLIPRVFEQICPEGSFEACMSTARSLIEHAKGKVMVRMSGILTLLNPDEGLAYRDFWRQMGVDAWIRKCHGRGGNLDAPGIYCPGERGLKAGGCGLIKFHAFISWEGEMLACCHDLAGNTGIGNINTCTLDRMAVMRDAIAKRHIPFELCRRCDEPLRNVKMPEHLPKRGKKGLWKSLRSMGRQMKLD